MNVWKELVGQQVAVAELQNAIADPQHLTHAWLFTGPPGSGRSNAARSFAAALQCEAGGCGDCQSCRLAVAGGHPDITAIATDGLSISVDSIREYVRKSALQPAFGRWQVLVVEDADRLTDQAANALLKALEEPSPRTVWMLCAPSSEDVLVTIRSRCRPVLLRTPSAVDITSLLIERDGIEPELAAAMAAASQGHIGRARGLAKDESARQRRREILRLPMSLHRIGDCLEAAQRVHAEAIERAASRLDAADAAELSDLRESWGMQERGRRPAGYAGALSALEKDQKRRRTRISRDAIDGVLLDLLSFCRDVAVQQQAPGTPLINADVAEEIGQAAALWKVESTIDRMAAIVRARESLAANAAPLLVLERMMIGFLSP